MTVRSRAIQVFAIIFAALSLAVAASGYILTGGSGFQDFARTAASLLQLVLMLVPLVALVTGVLALSPERGASELLFSQPVSRRAILIGKLTGLFAALAAAQLIGLGAAGLVIYWKSAAIGLSGYGFLVLGSLLATAVCLALAALLASRPGGRTRALAAALVVWFVGLVLFDIAALGVASLLPSGPASRVLILGQIVNPIGAIRIGVLLILEGSTAFGSGALALLRFTRGPIGATAALALSLISWLALPLWAAVRRLSKADL
jgi:Cu-processing system permease protein